MSVLLEFLLRLIAGMAAAMSLTSARHVSAGFFRNHLYVVLGLATLACLVALSLDRVLLTMTAPLAVLAYAGAVSWLYEARRVGKLLLGLIGGLSLFAACQVAIAGTTPGPDGRALGVLVNVLDVGTSSWLLGAVLMSMLLGHWYLNAPEMEIAPLRKLLTATYVGLAARVVVSGGVLAWGARGPFELDQVEAWLLILRWLFGFVGLAAVLWMAWQTLKIPNTQSATGLLYIAAFAVLAGELVSLLLSAQHAFAV